MYPCSSLTTSRVPNYTEHSILLSTSAVLIKSDSLSSPVHLSSKTSAAIAESHSNSPATADFSGPSSASGGCANTSEPQLLSSQLNLLQVRDNLCRCIRTIEGGCMCSRKQLQ